MNALYSFLIVAFLLLVAVGGAASGSLNWFFAVGFPYLAIVIFLVGFIGKVMAWAQVPVPFRITTTSGQQKSLPWIKSSRLDNPHDLPGVLGRMFLEVFFFRSLFRNTRVDLGSGRVTYAESKWLWAGAMVFHYSFLAVIVRHFRFFLEPVPSCLNRFAALDGFFEIGVPVVYMSGLGLLAGVSFLLVRRFVVPQLRYTSLPADFFPLYLLLGISVSGLLLRYVYKVDLIGVKSAALGLVSFHPVAPEVFSPVLAVHLFFVFILLAYFPFSKLMHAPGVFFSPTRNLANNNRAVRHVNPWNAPVKVHTYEEYEDEFRDLMKGAGLPLEKGG